MKKRHMLLINLIFIGLALFSAAVVFQFFTGTKPLAFIQSLRKETPQTVTTVNCNTESPISGVGNATHPSLRKLQSYQQACKSQATKTIMVFISMPSTTAQAVSYAKDNAVIFREFAKYGIRPLVIVEPSDHDGTLLNFERLADGTYTPALDAYFTQLKAEGLQDSQLGIWNPLPEANLPYWNNNQARFFAPAVTAHLQTARKHFPKLTTSILLNSASYESTDFNWENGDYVSLLPYVKGIPQGLVDYAGVQGFPWISRQTNGAVIFNAAEFISPNLLTEMAKALGTKKLWFNTGTFGSKYTLDVQQTKHITPAQRKEILMTVQAQATRLQQQDYEVNINLFAQDKSQDVEETDWSYWKNGQPLQSPDAPVLTEFIRDMHKANIGIWLFDR